MKPLLDLLATIPSVVYGVWGVIVIVPLVGNVLAPLSHRWLESISLILKVNQPTGFSILAGGIVLAVMIMPFIIAVIYEVLMTVPEGTRQAALGLSPAPPGRSRLRRRRTPVRRPASLRSRSTSGSRPWRSRRRPARKVPRA